MRFSIKNIFLFTYSRVFIFCFALLNLTSCYEKLDFDQIEDYVLKPVLTSSLTNFTLLPIQFFNDLGVQSFRTSDVTEFEIFNNSFIRDNVVKIEFFAEIKNEFDRDVIINITFLDINNNPVFTFTPIEVNSNDVDYTYLEEIEIAGNPSILNTFKVKIEAELENTGTQMNPNSKDEFNFKSSITVFIESEF